MAPEIAAFRKDYGGQTSWVIKQAEFLQSADNHMAVNRLNS
jgi:hypothetical protein